MTQQNLISFLDIDTLYTLKSKVITVDELMQLIKDNTGVNSAIDTIRKDLLQYFPTGVFSYLDIYEKTLNGEISYNIFNNIIKYVKVDVKDLVVSSERPQLKKYFIQTINNTRPETTFLIYPGGVVVDFYLEVRNSIVIIGNGLKCNDIKIHQIDDINPTTDTSDSTILIGDIYANSVTVSNRAHVHGNITSPKVIVYQHSLVLGVINSCNVKIYDYCVVNGDVCSNSVELKEHSIITGDVSCYILNINGTLINNDMIDNYELILPDNKLNSRIQGKCKVFTK
jgi:hypothetical protein